MSARKERKERRDDRAGDHVHARNVRIGSISMDMSATKERKERRDDRAGDHVYARNVMIGPISSLARSIPVSAL